MRNGAGTTGDDGTGHAGRTRGRALSGGWKRLRKRKLVQWPLAYLAAAWVLVQVCNVLGAQFGWSAGVLRGITLVFGIGFFLVLIVTWYHGERGRQKVGVTELSLIALVLAVGGVLLWRFVPSGPEDMPLPPALGPHSVAVLPFENFSTGADDAFFADGLADTVLNRLAQLHGLKVIARNSSFTYKGANVDVRRVGRELGVAAVLEGSVQRQGERIRVIAQLVDTADGSHRWAQTFDSAVSDLFRIQDEISVSVAKALEVELLEGEDKTLAAGATTHDPLVLEAVLRGNELLRASQAEAALAQFREALRRDPDHAQAWVGISRAYNGLAFRAVNERDYQAHTVASRHAVERALELAPDLPAAQDALAWVLMREGRDHDLLALSRLRLASAPNESGVLAYAPIALMRFGQWPEALALAERSIAIDPLVSTHYRRRAMSLLLQGRIGEAKAAYEAALERFPGDTLLLGDLAIIAGRAQGDWEAAMRWLLRGNVAGDPQLLGYIAMNARRLGLRESALHFREALRASQGEDLETSADQVDWFVAEGQPGIAADNLQRAMTTGTDEMRTRSQPILSLLCLLAQRPDCALEQARAARGNFIDSFTGQVRIVPAIENASSEAHVGLVEQRLGDAELGAQLLRGTLERLERSPWLGWSTYRIPARAELLAALGEREAALAELEAALSGDPEAVFLNGLVPGLAIERSPYFDSISEEPRFIAAMAEIARRRQHAAGKVQKLLDDYGLPVPVDAAASTPAATERKP